MSLKLYYHPLSTFSRRVRIGFAEKQIPHELAVVDMAARHHREQPYLSLNPYGRVPTLSHSNRSAFGAALMQLAGSPKFWGADPKLLRQGCATQGQVRPPSSKQTAFVMRPPIQW